MKNLFTLLFFTITGSLTFSQPVQWTFNSGNDGWMLANSLSGTVNSGVYDITVTGADPFMLSPDNLNINATAMGEIKIRLQNLTPDTQFQVFWTSTADNTWSQNKSVLFTAIAND